MDLQTYKKLKRETKETVMEFGKSSLSEMTELELETEKLGKEFITRLEEIKIEALRKKIKNTPTSL